MTAAGFRIRKVKVEQSIGDKLKRARTRQKLSVAEAEEATKIRAKFILALESDSWDQIPSKVYGRGYLEAYAEYLKLPVEQMMKQYDSARAMYSRHTPELVELAPATQQPRLKFLLTPRFFVVSMTIVLALAFAGVVGFQLHRFTAAPFLELDTAEAKEVGSSQLEVYTDSFTVRGRTIVGASVTINGQPVPVSGDGSFQYEIPMQRGVNAVVVKAEKTPGIETGRTLTVTVK